MKKNVAFLTLALFATLKGFTQTTTEFFEKSDSFFGTYVENGRVAYSKIKSNPQELNDLVEMAKAISVDKSNTNDYQAFWINGYNLLVIQGIIDNYPLKSPLDVSGFFDRTKYEIGGLKTTLNDIENKLLRANFPKEPRFHFVLVCGGLGCPPIINKAYQPDTLDEQLEKQTKLAINDPNFIRIKKNKVQVSQIFEWYPGDFKLEGKDLVDFLNRYKSEALPDKSKISYYPYDWTLNEIK